MSDVEMRTCKTCGATKPSTLQYWHKSGSRKPDGSHNLLRQCRDCENAKARQRDANRRNAATDEKRIAVVDKTLLYVACGDQRGLVWISGDATVQAIARAALANAGLTIVREQRQGGAA